MEDWRSNFKFFLEWTSKKAKNYSWLKMDTFSIIHWVSTRRAIRHSSVGSNRSWSKRCSQWNYPLQRRNLMDTQQHKPTCSKNRQAERNSKRNGSSSSISRRRRRPLENHGGGRARRKTSNWCPWIDEFRSILLQWEKIYFVSIVSVKVIPPFGVRRSRYCLEFVDDKLLGKDRDVWSVEFLRLDDNERLLVLRVAAVGVDVVPVPAPVDVFIAQDSCSNSQRIWRRMNISSEMSSFSCASTDLPSVGQISISCSVSIRQLGVRISWGDELVNGPNEDSDNVDWGEAK